MIKLLIITLLALSLFKATEAQQEQYIISYKEGIAQLTDSNFEQFIAENEFVFVKFFAPWCGHCQQMAPEWIKAAKTMKEAGNKVIFAEMDATVHTQMPNEYSVEGYPTLMLFSSAIPISYQGQRDSAAIIEFVEKKQEINLIELKTPEELSKQLNDNDALLVFFFEKPIPEDEIDAHDDFNTYQAISKIAEFNYLGFAHSFNPDLPKEFGIVRNGTSVVLFRNYDEERVVVYDGERGVDNIQVDHLYEKFLLQFIYKTILELDETTMEKIFVTDELGLFLLVDDSQKSQKASQALEQVANSIKHLITLVKTPIVDGLGERLAEFINVQPDQLPQMYILDFRHDEEHDGPGEDEEDMKKYRLKGNINEKTIQKFVEDFKENKLEVEIMSEEIPKEQTGPVKVLVGSNFEKSVLNQKYDTLVKFYAPWCGHCKAMIPEYEELAKQFQNDKKIVIAEIDATKNDTPGVYIEGYPTIKFFQAGIESFEEAMEYEGERVTKDMYEYVQQNRASQVAKNHDDL